MARLKRGLVGIAAADDGEHGSGAVFHDDGGALEVFGLLALVLGDGSQAERVWWG